jgi:hypothetical protein
MHSDRKLPERATTGIDASLKSEVDREARRHDATAAPKVTGGYLLERIEHRMREREFDL